MRGINSLILAVRWACGEFFQLVYQPTVYVARVKKEYDETGRQWSYLLRFVGMPVLAAVTLSCLVAAMCAALDIKFSGVTTVKGMAVGIVAALCFCASVVRKYGIAFALAFGMSAGIIVGFTFSVWLTIPIEGHNSLTVELAGPPRTLMNGMAMGMLGGLMFHTITEFLGKMREALTFSLGLGLLYTIAVGYLIDVPWGILGGLTVGVFFALGFSQSDPDIGALAIGPAIGAVIGFAAGAFYQPIWWKAVSFIGTTALFWLSYFRVLYYPTYAFGGAVVFARAQRNPESIHSEWQRFPVHDEMLRLRLPYTTEFLIYMGRQDKTWARKEVLRVIADRPLHKPDAIEALFVLLRDDLEVKSLENISAAAQRFEWIQNARISFPELEGTLKVVDIFRSLSLSCAQYEEFKGRQVRIWPKIDSINNTLRELKESLMFLSLPRRLEFQETVSVWAKLINDECEEVRLREEVKMSGSPYGRTLATTDGGGFVGRSGAALFIENAIFGVGNPENLSILLLGPRRIGKTSLLYQLQNVLDRRVLPVIVDLQHIKGGSSFSAHLSYIVEKTEAALLERDRRVQSQLASLSETIGYRPDNVTLDQFDQWSRQIKGLLPEPDITRLLLCIDEYETIREIWEKEGRGLAEDILALYRGMSQNSHFVLMLVGANTYADLGEGWEERFPKTHLIQLGILGPEDAMALLKGPLSFAEGVKEEIIRQTGCQPLLIQAVAEYLLSAIRAEEISDVAIEDVDDAVSEVIEEGSFFAEFWKDAGSKGQEILRAVAKGENLPLYPEKREWLERNLVLDASGKFVVPMFERWVREQAEFLD